MSTPAFSGAGWPPNYQGCTVTGQFIGLDGHALSGTVTFTASPASLLDSGDQVIIAPRVLTAPLDANGSFSLTLPATDDPDINPINWTYLVSENFTGGRKYAILAPQGATIDLSEVAPVPASAGVPTYRGRDGNPGILLLGPTDPVPPGTPTGQIIAREQSTPPDDARYVQMGSYPSQQAAAAYPQAALRRFHIGLGKRTTEPCDVLVVGDDQSSGQAQTKLANTWPQKFMNTLRQKFPTSGVAGGLGYIGADPAVYAGTAGVFTDIPVAVAGTPTLTTFAGDGYSASSATLRGAGDSVTFTFTGDAFSMPVALAGPSLGSAKVTIDGSQYQWDGTEHASNLTLGGANIATSVGTLAMIPLGITGLTREVHTVVVTWVSGQFIIGGLFSFDGDAAAGMRLVSTAIPFAGSSSFFGTGTNASRSQWIALNVGVNYFPDLVVIALGNADQGGSSSSIVSSATFTQNVAGLINSIKAAIRARTDGGEIYTPSFVVVPMPSSSPAPQTISPIGGDVVEPISAYWNALYALGADDPDSAVSVFDVAQRLVTGGVLTGATFDGAIATDGTHFTDAGADWIAHAMAEALTPQ